jgi:hypothetical protein
MTCSHHSMTKVKGQRYQLHGALIPRLKHNIQIVHFEINTSPVKILLIQCVCATPRVGKQAFKLVDLLLVCLFEAKYCCPRLTTVLVKSQA